jgi:signal transduction histidine kinase
MPPDLDALFAVVPDMVFEMSSDGIYLSVNSPAAHPYSPDSHGPTDGLLGKSMWDVLPREGAEIAQQLIDDALRTNALQTGHWSRSFPDGAARHYEARVKGTSSGSVVMLIRDTTDSTDRAETLQALYDAMPSVVCHVDRAGRCLECHGKLQVGGRARPADPEPPGLHAAVRQLHSRALESDDIQSYRYSVEGSHFVARARRTRINTVVYVVQDETEQVETLNELQKSNDYLQRFAYFASHDLQEPLRGMHGPAQVLLDEVGPKLEPTERKWLEYIHANSERAHAMVRDMLEFSRSGTQPPKPEFFDGELAVLEVLDSFRAAIEERSATVTVKRIPHLYYDRVKFMAMIANLLSNGLKFHRDGVDPVVEISGRGTSSHMVTIVVIDNGIGIPREAQKKVLEPGQRLHHRDKYPGNGLGLSSVAMILDRCGGSLGIRSVVGQGSEFQLTLPGGLPHVQ